MAKAEVPDSHMSDSGEPTPHPSLCTAKMQRKLVGMPLPGAWSLGLLHQQAAHEQQLQSCLCNTGRKQKQTTRPRHGNAPTVCPNVWAEQAHAPQASCELGPEGGEAKGRSKPSTGLRGCRMVQGVGRATALT